MAFSNGDFSPADLAAVMGNNNGSFMDGNNAFFYFILFLFFIMGGWNGNGNGLGNNNNQAYPAWQQSFDQVALTNQLAGISAAVTSGFTDVNSNLTNQLNAIAMSLQNCCCENRAATADLKYTVATEACNTRQANSDNTQLLLNAINGGIQSIQDKLCQQEIDALKAANANLQTQINLSNLKASQNEQTAAFLADNARQTVALEQYLNPTAVPAYIVQNPNCCQGNFAGCGCGSF